MESHGPSLGKAVRPARSRQSTSVARTNTAGAFLRRGLGAGFLAGIISGLFLLVVGVPSIDEAIRQERAASGGHAAEVVFSRAEQHAGMVVASGLYGLVLGGVLGLVVFVMSRRMLGTAWQRSMRVALTGFGAYFLIPFLKYPANPPGVGDPETFGVRTGAYLFLVAVSVGACFLGIAVGRRLSARGVQPHNRHLGVAACLMLLVGTAFVALPAAVDPEGIPAPLIWDFRMASLGGQAVLWSCTGAILGLLTLRAERRNSEAGESLPATD